jgi:F-type H+-transporting ATPase subunit a
MSPLLLVIIYFVSSHIAIAAGDGVSLTADEAFSIGTFPVTNSMITSWVISGLIIFVIRILVGKTSLVPSRGQIIVESVVSGIRGITEPIVGKKVFFPTFWLLSGLFIFILIQNLSGLLPGVGTIGNGYYDEDGHFVIKNYLIRPGNADLNMTLALAGVANLCWLYFIFKFEGLKSVASHIFGNKAEKKEVGWIVYTLLIPLFFCVGAIEIVSILFRPISLSCRLFGNVYGGESLLHSMFALVPQLQWILPLPFYFMEVLIGIVQALVFMLLIAVYIGLMCNHGDEHH